MLDDQQRVCHYSAGTDTNPIFLFSKATIESQSFPSMCPHNPYSDMELKVSLTSFSLNCIFKFYKNISF